MAGLAISRPASCPESFFDQIMQPCFAAEPTSRLPFAKLCTALEGLVQAHQPAEEGKGTNRRGPGSLNRGFSFVGEETDETALSPIPGVTLDASNGGYLRPTPAYSKPADDISYLDQQPAHALQKDFTLPQGPPSAAAGPKPLTPDKGENYFGFVSMSESHQLVSLERDGTHTESDTNTEPARAHSVSEPVSRKSVANSYIPLTSVHLAAAAWGKKQSAPVRATSLHF